MLIFFKKTLTNMRKCSILIKLILINQSCASMLELADRHVWGACVYDVWVQVPLLAPQFNIAGLCKGSTSDSDSLCLGSNPSPAAMSEQSSLCSVFLYRKTSARFLVIDDKISARFFNCSMLPHFTISRLPICRRHIVLQRDSSFPKITRMAQNFSRDI